MTRQNKTELLFGYKEWVAAPSGAKYDVRAYGERGGDRLWHGWLAFFPPHGHPVVTDWETTQPNQDTLVYWASGLGVAYLQGALERALRREPLATLARLRARRERDRRAALREAKLLREAASARKRRLS